MADGSSETTLDEMERLVRDLRQLGSVIASQSERRQSQMTAVQSSDNYLSINRRYQREMQERLLELAKWINS